MCFTISILVVEPNHNSRESLLQAIHYQGMVSHVIPYKSLDDALSDIRTGKKADIIFVSAAFPARALAEFISCAKQSVHGRDGAFLMIFEASVERVAIAKNLLHGTDAFIVAPFSVDTVERAIQTAAKIRRQNMVRRIETAVRQIVEILRDEVTYVACDKALGKNAWFKSNAHDASDILRSFGPEEKEIYFDLLLNTFGRISAPHPLLGHARTSIENSDVMVDGLIEALKSSQARVRAHAARTLASLGRRGLDAVPYLQHMLEDSDRLCAHRAKVALARIAPPELHKVCADEIVFEKIGSAALESGPVVYKH